MSDLLNQASLVMVPSGYKEDTVYSVVPSDGSGDLSFTRASNGTRVNSAGLVEVVPWNLLQYSEQIGNGIAWQSLNGISITANDAVAPNGTTTADKLTDTSAGSSIVRQFDYNIIAGQTYTFSVYLKKASGSPVTRLRIEQNQSPFNNSFIDVTPTNEWVRYSVTRTLEAGITDINFGILPDINADDSVYAWGAQLNIGSTAKPYFPTTDRLNVPRLTYQNGGGGCPSLLLEPQRTNLALYSEEFGNAYWTKNRSTITANSSATLDPSGANGADKIVETATTLYHGIERAFGTLSGNHCLSVFAKAAERNWVYLEFFTGATSFTSFFDLSSGTIGTSAAGNNAKIENYGNGWYRLSISRAAGSGTSFFVAGLATADNTPSYTGNGTSGAYFYGAQLEAGAYPTSYIPTTSSSATRVADACFKDGLSVFGTNQGTFFVDSIGPKFQTAAQYLFDLSDNSAGNRFALYSVANNELSLYTNTGNNFSADVFARNKIAISWNGTTCKLYMNGTQMLNISCPTSNPTSINLNSRFNDVEFGDCQFNEVVCFPTALTNAELASLTTI